MKQHTILNDFIKYASLNVLGMIGLSCYILADTFFISKGLGADGLTALNLAIPVYSFIHGSGLMIGMGGGTRYSILKSQNRQKDMNQVFTNAAVAFLLPALFFFCAGLFFSAPLTHLLGANETVFEMTQTYLRVILFFAPAFMLNNLLLCFVRNDGAPQLSMLAMLMGSFSNILLDYIFIFPCKMGIFGAVLATGFAPLISILILSTFFFQKKNHFLRKMPHFSRIDTPHLLRWSAVSDHRAFVRHCDHYFNMIILNLQGNTGVAAYGIIANISLVVISVYTGIAQGIQPILSSSYGKGDRTAVHSILRYALITMLAISVLVYLGIFFGAEQITAIFNSEKNVLLQQTAVKGLVIYFTACVFAGFNIILSVYFTSTEFARPAHVISLLRGVFVIIPMAFFLSYLFGMTGVWLAFPVTELLVSILGGILFSGITDHRRLAGKPQNHKTVK